ncbi:type IV pili methyl-accepting chemotaxis transducer N-terminal domain-containing protein [Hydrogenophaga sp. 5NK40-0174]|uniref:type IV pili methyl-accepting chemotaxis transducer N-terminal domain-containing protein n=1 Tax=Hydrogenophaga sp. 5NK40-0174 TaxID=3127649 RepID=UPI00310A96D8
MMKLQRRSFVALACAALPSAWAQGTGAAPWTPAELNLAINMAGRQRMLSQRVIKAWLASTMLPGHAAALKVLESSKSLFEKQLTDLSAKAPSQEIRSTYLSLAASWNDLQSLLGSTTSTPDAVRTLIRADARVLSLAHQGTQQYEAVQNQATGALVNLAGRQRMLTQRMAKFYFTSAMGVDTDASMAELQKARGEFEAALARLKAAPEATPRILAELQLGETQWVFFQHALKRLDPGTPNKTYLSDVFVTSENLLQVMDKVTHLFASLEA